MKFLTLVLLIASAHAQAEGLTLGADLPNIHRSMAMDRVIEASDCDWESDDGDLVTANAVGDDTLVIMSIRASKELDLDAREALARCEATAARAARERGYDWLRIIRTN